MRASFFSISLVTLTMLAGSLGCERGDPPDSRRAPEDSAAASPAATGDGSAMGEAARQDLARRLGRPTDEIRILEVRSVYWRSAALGCPDPEQSYAHVLTKGWFIRLGDGRSEYRYHAGETGEPFTCNPRRAEPPLEHAAE